MASLSKPHSFYLIGSLRNPQVPVIANALRAVGLEVFDDWFGAGPEADDHWMAHEKGLGRSYGQALDAPAAWNVFRFDQRNILARDGVILAMPAGKSGHLEFGYAIGSGKPGYILFDQEPERWDVMYRFATGVYFSLPALIEELK